MASRRAGHLLRHLSVATDPMTKTNALMSSANMPAFNSIQPADVKPALEALLQQLKGDLDQLNSSLAGESTPQWETVNEELERTTAQFSHAWGVTGHLMAVKNSSALREAHKVMEPAVVDLYQQMGQSRPIYQAYKIMRDSGKLDAAQQRIAEQSILRQELSGIGLAPDSVKNKEFNELQLELSQATTQFSNNVLDATNDFQLHVDDESMLNGIPASSLALMGQAAKEKGHASGYLLGLDMPSMQAVLTHAKDRGLREQIYRAHATKASHGSKFNNHTLIAQILNARTRKAHFLGFSDHAEVSMASKMAEVEDVVKLMENLRAEAYPRAEEDLRAMQEYAATHGHEGDLRQWDISFWSERMREDLYQVNEEELKQYFPFPIVLEGLFNLSTQLFGIIIEPADGEADVWHPDVRFFKVYEQESSEHIASFYLDPFVRPAEKRGGAWMGQCASKSSVLGHLPVAYLVCNQAPGVGNKPSLMNFREVTTLWHEFGHGLQHMLTKVPYTDAAGISGIEWDAVELPSQMMENFIMSPSIISTISKHQDSGAILPQELHQRLKDADKFMSGYGMLRQLYFSMLDLELHRRTPLDGIYTEEWVAAIQKEVAGKYQVQQPLPDDAFLCSFGHIFAGGYSAGYYSYKWAEVMSEDAFACFEEAGIDKNGVSDEVKAVGKRFRETVLALGGSQSASDVFRAFRGREPDPKSLLNRYFGE